MSRFRTPRDTEPGVNAISSGQYFPYYAPASVLGSIIPGVVPPYNRLMWSGVLSFPKMLTAVGAITANVRVAGDVGATVRCEYIDRTGFLRRGAVVTAGPIGTEEPLFQVNQNGVITATPAAGTAINRASVGRPFTGLRNVGAIDLSIDDVGTPEPQIRIPAPTAVEPNVNVSVNRGYPGQMQVPRNWKFLVCNAAGFAAGVHVQRWLAGNIPDLWDGDWELSTGVGFDTAPVAFDCAPMVFGPADRVRIISESVVGEGPGAVPFAYLAGVFVPSGIADPNPELIPPRLRG